MRAAEHTSDSKLELDDSGCVQDVGPPKTEAMEEEPYPPGPQLLDLSDDVLLYILRYCSPHDLKALGFTCSRLGSLVLERSLWTTVDARGVPTSRARMRWLLQALHSGTRALLLTGHAEEAHGCRGHVNRTRKEAENEWTGTIHHPMAAANRPCNAAHPMEPVVQVMDNIEGPYPILRRNGRVQISALHAQLPRQSSCPYWPEDCEWDDPGAEREQSSADTAGCPGPVFTLSAEMMHELRARCPRLTALSLDYCNINCNKINPSNFPPSVKRLSLRGTRCYNPPLDKSYLFKIHDYLPALEYLDVSECAWLEPAALLPLSKLVNLRVLLMRACPALAEFVAYVSLATRYGFRALKVLDLRESPVADSEVAALGWLPELQELYLSAPPAYLAPPSPAPHHHYVGDPLPRRPQMDEWEIQVPEYYKMRSSPEPAPESPDVDTEDIEAQAGILRSLGHFNSEIQKNSTLDLNQNEDQSETRSQDHPESTENEEVTKRTLEDQNDEAGPSKRTREECSQANQNDEAEDSTSSQTGDDNSDYDNDTDDSQKSINTDTSQTQNKPTDNNKTNKYRIFKNKNTKDEPGPSKETKKTQKRSKINNSDSNNDSDDDTQPKKPKINDGAGTSKLNDTKSIDDDDDSESGDEDDKSDQPGTSHGEERLKVTPSESTSERDGSTTYKYKIDVNDGASTSRYSIRVQVHECLKGEPPRLVRNVPDDAPAQPSDNNGQGSGVSARASETRAGAAGGAEGAGGEAPGSFVRFRRNQAPIVIQCPPEPRQAEQAEPRQHVLYVNLGQQVHAYYRMVGEQRAPPPAAPLPARDLVTDNAIRRFGRADGEDFNIVNIGPNGPQFGGRDTSGRPNRSNLRVLSATGYTGITDRSLLHLATAAPRLQQIDFTGTAVSRAGVAALHALRPDLQVTYTHSTESEE